MKHQAHRHTGKHAGTQARRQARGRNEGREGSGRGCCCDREPQFAVAAHSDKLSKWHGAANRASDPGRALACVHAAFVSAQRRARARGNGGVATSTGISLLYFLQSICRIESECVCVHVCMCTN